MLPRTPSPQARGARPWRALALAVAALGLGVGQARADVIDFDPRSDQVPDILSPDDLGRYSALISAAAGGAGISTLSTDRRHVIKGNACLGSDCPSGARIQRTSLVGSISLWAWITK